MHMPRKELDSLTVFLRAIYVFQDVASLHRAICDGLGKVIAGDNVCIGEHDMHRTLVTGCNVRHVFETPDFISVVNSCVGEHPLWEPMRTGGQVVRAISDFASRRKWENSTLYREALGREGVRDHMSVEFGDRAGKLVSVGVFRESRGFHTREVERLGFLIPHLEQAFENARRFEAIGANRDDSSGAMMIIELNGAGVPLEIPSEALRIFDRFFGDARHGWRRFPDDLTYWIRKTRGMLVRGALECRPAPFRRCHRGESLEARLLRRRWSDGYHLVMCASRNLADLHFTPREREVWHWVREGKSNEEIARIQGIGLTTVKTHVKHLLRKLGVENRTAAARLFPGSGGASD